MASENKKKKLKNSYCGYWALKEKKLKLKRTLFYTSSQRKAEKAAVRECYEVMLGNGNCHTQIILCKDCLKELNMLSGAILERDKEEPKVTKKIVNGSLLETYNIAREE